MNQLFVNFGNLITEEILSKLIKIVNEWADETDEVEFKDYTVNNYKEIVQSIQYPGDYLVQLVSYIFGEYSLQLSNENEEEIEENFRLLEYLLEKQYDNEKTKAMILTAFTKLHINLDFKGFEFVGEIMSFFSKSRNVEIQQKANEYLRMKNYNLLKAKEFILSGANRDFNLDKSLSFLDGFVRKKIQEGSRKYSRTNYENKISFKDSKSLNLGPYPESIIHKQGGKPISGISNSKESKDFPSTTKNGPKTLWTQEGFKNDKEEEIKRTSETPKGSSIVSVGSALSSIKKGGDTTVTSNPDPRLARVQGGGDKKGNKSFPETNKPKKEPEQKYDPKKAEKEDLKNKLFSKPKTITEIQQVSQTQQEKSVVSNANSTQPQKSKPGFIKTKNNNITNQGNNNLIDFGGESNTESTIVETQKTTVESGLMDIFGLGGNESQSNTENQGQPQTQSNNLNFDDIFNMGNNSNNPKTAETTNDEIFNMFGSSNASKLQFTQHNISTDSFGEMWVDCPNEEFTITIISHSIKSPQDFFNYISQKGISCVEIINEEAIACCKFNGEIILLHSTISPTEISILIKSNNLNTMNEVKNILTNGFFN